MTVYVGNLSYDVTKEDLQEVFKDYGSVSRVSVPMDRETGRPRGFAFIEMEQEADESSAIEALDGAEWMGREMRVNKANPREGGGGGGNRRTKTILKALFRPFSRFRCLCGSEGSLGHFGRIDLDKLIWIN
ncbi:MAG: RNA-binding protein [Merismopedia sp. SIO2A8]|nr:RNA-binding protein [Merismopedia sp. SIO2A8]